MDAADAIPEEPAGELTGSPLWRRLLLWLSGALVVLAVALGLLLVGLDTGPGRDFVARRLSGMTFANGLRIGIGRIDGSLYGKARLTGVVAYDPRGAFLRAPAVELDWRPFAYLGGHVDIRSVSADSVVLQRTPSFRPSPRKGPLLPDLDIDVGRLRVDHLVAEPAVTGVRRDLRLYGSARIADHRAQLAIRLTTLAAPGGIAGGTGGDRLDLALDAVPEANRLALRVHLEAPRDGVIAALTGLREPLSLRLGGSGDWAKWDGALAADLAGSPIARLGLTARSGTFRVKGAAEPGRAMGGLAARLLDQSTQVDLAARFAKRRAALSGSLRSQALAVVPTGVIDLGSNRFDRFSLDLAFSRPTALAPKLIARDLRGQFRFDGRFSRPEVQYSLTSGGLAINDIALQSVTASGKARITAEQALVPVAARIGRIDGLDGIAGGPLADVRLDGDLAVKDGRILSDNMKIRSDRIDARAILLADLRRGFYTGALEGRINAYEVDSVGTFAVATAADLKRTPQGFALTGTVRARSTRLANPGLRDFLGGNLAGSSRIAYGTDGVFRFSQLRIAAPQLQVHDGHGSYVPGGAIDLSASGQSSRYGPLSLTVSGSLAKPRAVLLAGSPGLGIGLADLRAEIVGASGTYRLAATGRSDLGPLNADVSVLPGKRLALQVNHGDLGGIGFAGRIERSAAGPFVGQFDANGRGLAGVIRLDAAGRYQQAQIDLQAKGTTLPGPANLSIGRAIVDARVILFDRPQVTADVQVAQARIRRLDLGAARMQIDYRDGRGDARFLLEGASPVPFRLAGNAVLEPGLWRAALDGRVRGIAVRTASPARIAVSGAGYELLPTRLDFGQGSVRLSGRYGDGLKLVSRLDRFDLALINAFAPGYGIGGTATGSLDFEQAGPDAFPRADARLTVNGFTRTTAAAVSEPVDVNFAGGLTGDGGEARAVIRRRGTLIGRLDASLRPVGPGAGGWLSRLMAAPLGGGIRYNGPAETLLSFAGQSDQTLVGPIAVGADFSGGLRQPQLTGIIRADNLVYENQLYGTRLTGLAVSGRFAGDRLQIDKLNATAGSGRISGQGYIGLAATAGYPMDLTIDLDNARLARSDALSTSATGQLRLSKIAGATAQLTGKLLLPETHYELVRQGASEVPELTGVRFKPQQGRVRITGNEPAAMPRGNLFGDLQLNVALVAPNQLFVTGMGLDSEWSANLRVTGTSAAPRLSGDVDLVRGTLGFAGRQFAMQDGRLLFIDGAPGDPQIALSATEDISDVTVSINVTGRAMNPQITFSSVPSLPSDEILARILFGNSVGQLSPVQALQLAASLNSLRGTGGGLNPLGKLRAATGISRLRILAPDEAAGRGTAIAAGRYISNNIYIEAITDARGFTATQIEVGLSRTLSILGQAGGSGLTNVNLRFRKRY